MLFKRATLFSLFSIFCVTGLLVYLHVRILPSDKEHYQKLVRETEALRSSKALERHPTYQVREGTQKDIWTVNGTERSHFEMHSDHSTLSVKQKRDKVEATEDLEGITCILQGPLIHAAKGFYDYPSHHFLATQVECSHDLGELKAAKAIFQSVPDKAIDPLLTLEGGVLLTTSQQGSSFSIHSQSALCALPPKKTFSYLENQKIEFFHEVIIKMIEGLSAQGGSAIYKTGSLTLYPEIPKIYCHLYTEKNQIHAGEIVFDLIKEQILCKHAKGTVYLDEDVPLLFSTDHLLWKKHEEKIELEQNVHIEQTGKFSIQANTANLILLNKNKPSFVEIEGDIHLFSPSIQNKDSFAVADRIHFSPIQQTMTLSAKEPKRVLFWQEGVSLSAPEIIIEKDPLTGEEFIQGKGDIHFTFNTEEQNIIDQFISKYL